MKLLLYVKNALLLAAAVIFLGVAAAPSAAAVPANDDFDHATVIKHLPFWDAQDYAQATMAADDPDWCDHWGGSLWYAFTPTHDTRITARVEPAGWEREDMPPGGLLSVWTGTRGSLTNVSCGAPFDAMAGETYYFMVQLEEWSQADDTSLVIHVSEHRALHTRVDTSKPAVVRGNRWLLRDALTGGPADHDFRFGRADDWPLSCDFDGDGQRTPVVVRGNQWFVKHTLAGGAADATFRFGRADDWPVCGNWDGRPGDGPGVVRGSTWLLRDTPSGGPATRSFAYGRADDWPVVGNWNGRPGDGPGVVRGATWLLRDTPSGGPATRSLVYGRADDWPVVGDWNDDGRDTVGVVRGSTWLLRDSLRGGPANYRFSYGRADDWPVTWR